MSDRVRILMGTYNGAAFLPEQLASLTAQTHKDWQLLCSDDGSTDGSQDLIRSYSANKTQKISVVDGPKRGFSENFLSMVRALPDDCGSIAFCDQDDIWFPDKLARAINALRPVPADKPALYGAASWIWNKDKETHKASLKIRHAPTFRNALIENFATGNTMVLNQPAALLLRDVARKVGPVFAHDWLAYAVISGAGGRIIYDDAPALLYRQHPSNEIGAGETFLKRQLRNLSVADGRYKTKVGQTVEALRVVEAILTPTNRKTLYRFMQARNTGNAVKRTWRIARSGVFRQSYRDMAGFYAAALLNKV